MVDPFDFEPAYRGLAALLIGSASAEFDGVAQSGSSVLTGIADTSLLTAGLGLSGASLSQGTCVRTVDTSSQITMTLPALSDGTIGVRTGFASTDPDAARRLRHWSDVAAAEQPALFVTEVDETATKRSGQPTQWTLNAKAYVYCQAPDANTAVAPQLNALLRAVRRALSRDAAGPGLVQNRQTLGGAVFDTYISGRIEKDEGYLGQQGVAIVPITLIANGP